MKRLVVELRERLEADNLSLRQASKLCGVSFATLSRLLRNGGDPSMQTFRALSAWLDGKEAIVRKQLHSRIVEVGGKIFRLSLEEL